LRHSVDLENVVSFTPVQPPGTLFHPIFVTSLTLVLSENNSRMCFLIVLITDYCRRSCMCRIEAPYKFYVCLIVRLIGLNFNKKISEVNRISVVTHQSIVLISLFQSPAIFTYKGPVSKNLSK